ncbi:spore coat protein [Anoxybacterium hadale]|uniref:Spore coat protein n=1 Tax=Anoxybacterium hadale TaxID=3408580 RepID=A0ACD1AAR2_9FIRM|nr:spore coat protein [Clostridiales bacterium]
MKIIQNLAGLGDMSEQIIAADFLLNAKATVRDYGTILSESSSPEIRQVLRKQLDAAITMQERIQKYMTTRNYYQIYSPSELIHSGRKNNSTYMDLQ